MSNQALSLTNLGWYLKSSGLLSRYGKSAMREACRFGVG
jgi:hypothetical protein